MTDNIDKAPILRCYRVWYRWQDESADTQRAHLVDAHNVDEASDATVRHFRANGQGGEIHVISVEDLDR